MAKKITILTINAPAIMKVREVIFLCGQNTLLGRDLHEKPQELPNKVLCPNTKNNFLNVIIVGALVVLCPRGLHTDIKSMKKSRSP